MARVWTIGQRPSGRLDASLFVLEDRPDPVLGAGEVRVRNHWLSVDPYMRGMIESQDSYMPTLPLGGAMYGRAVGEVVESRAAVLPVGSVVAHDAGWRDIAVVRADSCEAIADDGVPSEYYLGHFGMPGMTAYFGLLHAGDAMPDETLFVSSAAGAVGSAVVQIGKAIGMTVIGSAGGAKKCAAVSALGADAVIDYKAPGELSAKLACAAPDGIDVYFDNVAGDHLAAAIDNARLQMRVTLCGMISGYGGSTDLRIADPMRLVNKRISLRGHFAPDYYPQRSTFLADMRGWLQTGVLTCPMTVHDGLEAVPGAFISLFDGSNGVGKIAARLA